MPSLLKKKGRGYGPALRAAKFSQRCPRLSSGTSQREDPAMHARLGVLNIFVSEEFFQIDPLDGIDRTHKVALVAERNRGIDTHTAFEHGIGSGPFPLAGGHALGGHEGLPASPGEWIYNVGLRVYAGSETSHDFVPIIR